jgi:hypothetical protein
MIFFIEKNIFFNYLSVKMLHQWMFIKKSQERQIKKKYPSFKIKKKTCFRIIYPIDLKEYI